MDLHRTMVEKLEQAKNIWFASVRPDGRPHMVPVWFAWHGGMLYVCIELESVKGRNVARNPQVVLALEDGSNPLICEGRAAPVSKPWPKDVIAIFQDKYDWDLVTEARYNQLLAITPQKWLSW